MRSGEIVIGILAHVDAGKTTLTEAMLYRTGAIRRLGRVDKKDSHFDSHIIERNRGITIFSKQNPFTIREKHFTLIDTPGHVDFSAEMERTLGVLDYAVLVIDGTSGIQSHTETIWQLLCEYEIPVFIFVNKTDRDGFVKSEMMNEIKKCFGNECIDFTEEKEIFDEEISMISEEMLEAFLEGNCDEFFAEKEISKAISERKLFPCFFGSALQDTGVDIFLDGMEKYTYTKEYPDLFSARVYKILHDNQGNRLSFMKITGGKLSVKMPVGNEKIDSIRIYSGDKSESVKEVLAGSVCAVTGLSSVKAGEIINEKGAESSSAFRLNPLLSAEVIISDSDDIHTAYKKLSVVGEEQPELSFKISGQKGEEQIQIRVMGRIQLEILQSVVKDRFDMDIDFGPCRILYKETIKSSVMGYGHFEPLRHYAEAHVRIDPAERNSGITIGNECSLEVLDSNFQNLILTHIGEKEHIGILTGSPLTDVKITLMAGRSHLKHTEGGDFREATYRAIRQALEKADKVLLEPYYAFTLRVPVNSMGRAISDIQRLCGEFETPEMTETEVIIKGAGPVSEFMSYPEEVVAYTSGKGVISMRENGYRVCHNSEDVIGKIGYEKERDLENPSSSVFCSHGAGFEVKWFDVDDMRHIK
ncbi:MAG: TetM/TetW/TetO/TetS family tetracycline resistance ribosomal protection protein [Ruminococcaceae bacterium]|nr:TetM/TetW/TetO/TetS family tetracycline resistance ribosomal protection protein [Oscillospiraceae bacterium]